MLLYRITLQKISEEPYVLKANGGQFSISISGLNWIFSFVNFSFVLDRCTDRRVLPLLVFEFVTKTVKIIYYYTKIKSNYVKIFYR